MDKEFATMKEIGSHFGLTSHQVGKILKNFDYRTQDGRPAAKAFDNQMVTTKGDGEGHYIWIWHVQKLNSFLEELDYLMPQK